MTKIEYNRLLLKLINTKLDRADERLSVLNDTRIIDLAPDEIIEFHLLNGKIKILEDLKKDLG